MTECQNWIQDRFRFLRLHIRCKGQGNSSGFKSEACGASASAASALNISSASTNTDSIEISMQSTDITLQPQRVTSPTIASEHSSVDLQVMDHSTQMRKMLSHHSSDKRRSQHVQPSANIWHQKCKD